MSRKNVIAALETVWILLAGVVGVYSFCKMIETNSTAQVFASLYLFLSAFCVGYLANTIFEWRLNSLTSKK